MYKKIDKNYLSQTLMHLDIDGNQIIDPQEWLVFFDKYKNNIWMTAKTLLTYILKDTFPNESLEKLPMLAEAVLLNHCDDEEKKKINLLKLYNYVIRFIAPQKYRVYQQTLEDKKNFFLYDGVFQHQELEIFTDNNNRLLLADIFYLMTSYHITPYNALELVDCITKQPSVSYNPKDFTLDAQGFFNLLAIEKNSNLVIDIDGITEFANKHNVAHDIDDIFNLFGIHTELTEYINKTGQVDYELAYNFLHFKHKNYLELGIKSLFDALSIELTNTKDMLNLVHIMGYHGKPNKIFREIAGGKNCFTASEVKEFLNDNQIKFINK